MAKTESGVFSVMKSRILAFVELAMALEIGNSFDLAVVRTSQIVRCISSS